MSDSFGQIYQRMYQGSMFGSGAVAFALMGFIIANTDPKTSCVNLNPDLLAAILGESVEDVERGIEKLCSPDKKSNRKEHEGRRLIKRGEIEYFVVNFLYYRGLAKRQRENEQAAERMRRFRANPDDVTQSTVTVSNLSASASASDDLIGREGVGEKEENPFDLFWSAYPRRVAKQVAIKAFIKNGCTEHIKKIIKAVESQKQSYQWTKDGGQFIPHPATWLNQHRWEDELIPLAGQPSSNGSTFSFRGKTYTQNTPPQRKEFQSDDVFNSVTSDFNHHFKLHKK